MYLAMGTAGANTYTRIYIHPLLSTYIKVHREKLAQRDEPKERDADTKALKIHAVYAK
jgi:hypothetical protein